MVVNGTLTHTHSLARSYIDTLLLLREPFSVNSGKGDLFDIVAVCNVHEMNMIVDLHDFLRSRRPLAYFK